MGYLNKWVLIYRSPTKAYPIGRLLCIYVVRETEHMIYGVEHREITIKSEYSGLLELFKKTIHSEYKVNVIKKISERTAYIVRKKFHELNKDYRYIMGCTARDFNKKLRIISKSI